MQQPPPVVEREADVGQQVQSHAGLQQVEGAAAGLAEEGVALGGGALRVVHRVVRVAEAGGHAVGQQHAFGVGIDDELAVGGKVGQEGTALVGPAQCVDEEAAQFVVIGKVEQRVSSRVCQAP